MNGTTAERDGRWLASDGQRYPSALHPDPSRRPGWWLAADGRWYPPQRPAAPPSPPRRRSGRGWAVGAAVLPVVLVLGALANDEQESRLASQGRTTTSDAAVAAPADTTVVSTSTTVPPTTATTTAVVTTTSTVTVVGEPTTVGSITDGDTFRTAENLRVRLIGIDTPERGDCYFAEATARLAGLIPVGTSIRLEYDVDRRDRYGRTLAYVHRAVDALFVNAAMARDGYAQQLTVPPNVARAEELRSAVAEARDAGRGLWGLCQAEPSPLATPTTFTTVRPATTSTTAPAAKAACHSSYQGTCIPAGVSDADCAGGSGDGPWYVEEKDIRVVGPDVFGLDGNDNDGIGCESS